jgi:hypothetical protein
MVRAFRRRRDVARQRQGKWPKRAVEFDANAFVLLAGGFDLALGARHAVVSLSLSHHRGGGHGLSC